MKQPVRYEPTEEVEDDYSDHDDVESNVSSEISYESEEEDDDEGSLKDFVVESEEEDGGGTDPSEGSIAGSLHDE